MALLLGWKELLTFVLELILKTFLLGSLTFFLFETHILVIFFFGDEGVTLGTDITSASTAFSEFLSFRQQGVALGTKITSTFKINISLFCSLATLEIGVLSMFSYYSLCIKAGLPDKI